MKSGVGVFIDKNYFGYKFIYTDDLLEWIKLKEQEFGTNPRKILEELKKGLENS